MITKKRLFKPAHQQPNGLVLAYTCESDSLAVVPDSLVVACTMDSTAIARMDSIHAADRIEEPYLDPIGLGKNLIKKGVKKTAKSTMWQTIKEWFKDDEKEDEED
jgi:hypothetical protein